MKTTSKPTLPACLTVSTVAKWIDGDQHKFKLRLSNTETGQSMDFDYSGGCSAFLPAPQDLTPAKRKILVEVQAVFRKIPRPVLYAIAAKDAMQWANDNAVIDPCGVVHSLMLDSQAGGQTFADFCADYGYDSDSRKALATWEACVAIAGDFSRVCRGMTGELEALLSDY